MDECLAALLNERECLADEIFAHQVQLQMIVHKVAKLSNEYTESFETPKATLPIYLKAFRSQLLGVQQSFSPEAAQNGNAIFFFLCSRD
jgi:hypothetical protein